MLIAAALIILLGGTLRLAPDAEAQGGRLQYGDRVEGAISAASAADVWQFTGGAGDRVTVRLERLEGNLAPGLVVRDPAGDALLDVAWPSAETPVSEVTLRLSAGGEHRLEVRARQRDVGRYALSLILAQAGAPAGRADVSLSYGQSVDGRLEGASAPALWSFRGEAGDVIDVQLATPQQVPQPQVTLLSPTGSAIAAGSALLAVRLPMGGIYTLDIRPSAEGSADYRLTLALRRSAASDTSFAPLPLETGVPMRGRLSSDAPSALYRVRGSGALALALDLTDPAAQVDVTVLTENHALVDTFGGIGQVRASLSLGGLTAVWLEITSPAIAPGRPVDFEIRADQLRIARREARGLWIGAARHVSPVAEPDAWFFDARAGDLIELSLHPEVTLREGLAQVFDPQGELIFQRQMNSGFDQPLLLEQSGFYEVLVRSAQGEAYTIGLTRRGVAGIPLDLILDRVERGALGAAAPLDAAGDLAAQTADVWTLDLDEPGAWSFELATAAEAAPIGLRLESPAGTALHEVAAQPVSGAATLDWQADSPGRYRLIVFNAAPEGAAPYTLSAAPLGGGRLAPGEAGYGVLLEAQPENRWTLDIAGPALIHAAMAMLAGSARPDLALLGPDGLLVPLVPVGAAEPGATTASVTERGTYRFVVRQPATAPPTAYQIVARVDAVGVLDAPSASAAGALTLLATPAPLAPPITLDPREEILPATRPGPDVLGAAQPIALESTVRGQISQGAHYQVWRFQARSGQRVRLTAAGLEHDSAPDLTLLDEQGEIVARSFAPDRPENTLLHRFAAAGRYYVVARYDQGGRYLLRAEDRSALDPTVSAVLPGRVITAGETLYGELLHRGAAADIYFFAHAGDSFRAQTAWHRGAVSLRLETVGGSALATGLTDSEAPERASLDFRVVNDGLYRLVIQPAEATFAPGTFALHLALRAGTAAARDGGRLDGEAEGMLGAQNLSDTWLFSASVGERVSILAEPQPGDALALSIELTDTAGVPFLQRSTLIGAPALALNDVSLPRSGVYRLIIRATRGESGAYRLRLARDTSSLRDTERALPLNQTVSRVLAGDNMLDVWTFAGTQGDVISAEARVTVGDAPRLSFQIRAQDGAALATVAGDATGRAAASQVLLPATGHYTLAVGNTDPEFQGALAYELVVLLESTQARSMGTVLPENGRGAGLLVGADLRDVWLFEGRQGQVAAITISAVGGAISASALSTDWHIASTAGRPETLAAGERGAEGLLMLEPFVVPSDGVFAIDLSAPPGSTTRYTVRLALDSASALPVSSLPAVQPIEGRISSENPSAAWVFAGQAGDRVAARLVTDSRATLAPDLLLYGPAGKVLALSGASAGSELSLQPFALPESGQYTLAVRRRFGQAGATEGRFRLEVSLDPSPPLAARLLRYGQVGRSWINTSAPAEQWTFEGQAGDVVDAEVTVLSGTLDPVLRLYGPSDELLAEAGYAGGSVPRIRQRLAADAIYRLEVRRAAGAYGLTQGNYAIALDRVYRFVPGSADHWLAYGQRVTGTVDASAPVDAWVFSGAEGDEVRAVLRFPTDDAPPELVVADPDGTVLATGRRATGRAILEGLALPYSGTYTLEVRHSPAGRGLFIPYELTFFPVEGGAGAERAGGVLERSRPVYGRFADSVATTHGWLIRAANERGALSVVRLDGRLAVDLAVLAPDGTVLLEEQALPGAAALTTAPIDFSQAGLYAVLITARDEAIGLRYRLQLDPLGARSSPATE